VTIAEYQKVYYDKLSKVYDDREARSLTRIVFENILSLETYKLSAERFRILTTHQTIELDDILKRLISYEPVQYILEEADFFGLKFKVNRHVLIPRPETEELVAWIIESMPASKMPLTVLDIGTGSGCIPVSLSKKYPAAKIEAVDISADALQVAKENNQLNNTSVQFICKDILSAKLPDAYYDIIVSNPPYIAISEQNTMLQNVLMYEPHLALFVSDDDALIFYRTIAKHARSSLKPGGLLFFEINEAKGAAMLALMQEYEFEEIELRPDLSGKSRMIRGRKP
jgi:release factor glutamine methyltransferase